eukprot:scaffold647905_cov51-Prasinocladus_malaysianus.AAC.2
MADDVSARDEAKQRTSYKHVPHGPITKQPGVGVDLLPARFQRVDLLVGNPYAPGVLGVGVELDVVLAQQLGDDLA